LWEGYPSLLIVDLHWVRCGFYLYLMTTDEAAQLISETAEALRNNPSDFEVRVMTVGMQAIGGGGAPGAVGTAIGGGTGINVTARGGDVSITKGEGAFSQELERVCDLLQELAEAAKADERGRIRKLLGELQALAIVPVSILTCSESALRLADLIG
jgi:hypothetical protein